MTTTKPPVLTDDDRLNLWQPFRDFPVDWICQYARAIELLALERAGADAVRCAALEEAAALAETHANQRECAGFGAYDSRHLARGIRALKGTPAAIQDFPTGAIINGRAFAERLEAYPFDSEGGTLTLCTDWIEFRRCFEYLADWAQGTPAAAVEPFQARVQPWMMACFGEMIAGDREERNHRFLEESLELVQSLGCTDSEAHQLVDYVYGRPVGEPAQEVGGVMVTLAALCLANGMDMHAAGETELARIWTKVEQIRAKQAAKPKHSPLPQAGPLSGNAGEVDAITQAIWNLDRYKETSAEGGGVYETPDGDFVKLSEVVAAIAASKEGAAS